jgi:dsDNA-binding SOS-regulon protein
MHRHFIEWRAFSLALCFATCVSAQSTTPTQNPTQAGQSASQGTQTPTSHNNVAPYDRDQSDRDIDRQELARFDQFLDAHQKIASQLRTEPSLINDGQYLRDNPDLTNYLHDHPATRSAFQNNPTAFMQAEQNYEQREGVGNRSGDYGRDRGRHEVASFDQFLDAHQKIANQLRTEPSLINDGQYLRDNPDLANYLQDHPQVRQQLQQNPNAFMQQENRYDQRGDPMNGNPGMNRNDIDRDGGERSSFDQFLDSHREIAEQLRKSPSLADNQQFLKSHPALQSYMQQHPEVRQHLQQNPNAFMQQDNRYDRGQDAMYRNDYGQGRRQLAGFDQFLDSHREISEQLRKDPSLADNQQFLKNHPALQSYLQQHPEVRQQLQQNPTAFMQQENRYEHREDAMNRGSDFSRGGYGYDQGRNGDHDAQRRFGQFLGNHSDINQQLSKNPSLCKSDEYMQNHPELRSYLNSNPDVRQQLMSDPDNFVKSTQQWNATQGTKTTTQPTAAPSSAPTTPAPKPKQ